MKKIAGKKGQRKMLILAILAVLIIVTGIKFSMDSQAAQRRFASYEAKAEKIETSYGKLSFIDEGSGEAIISCHGICGGYDQAYDTLADKTARYRILAPSRFGYPGSDMPENATIEKQAAAYKAMLDYLGIDKAYILATSAGGTSAIKFALMYPERTKGLILYCSGYPRLEAPEKEISMAGPPEFLCSDLPMWLISPLFKPIMGMDSSTIKDIMPLKERRKGIVFDGKVTNTEMNNNYQEYDMSSLKVPVLMIHAKDDKLANFEDVAPWAEKIPDCTFVPLEGGGHLMKGQSDIINKALDEFIQRTK